MTNLNINELKIMENEIENELKKSQSDLKKVGSLTIKINSFKNMVSKINQNESGAKELFLKSKYFQQQIKILADRRTQEKQELEHEMESSKIRFKRITEASENNDLTDDKFFSQQSSKIDDFISKSMDSFRSLERQGGYIDKISHSIRRNFVNLGVGDDLLYNIETRFAGDKSLFYILIIILIILIFVLRFYFR